MIRKILCGLATLAGALILTLGLAAPAQAQAATWVGNQDSTVVDHDTVRLEGTNTSVETGNLNVNVDEGDEVSFRYELLDGALCEAGAPRLFLVVNGAAPSANKSEDCDGTGMPEPAGTITFTTDQAGLITAAGLVYDSGRPGHVLIHDLTIGGEPVHFQEPPEPTTQPTTGPTAGPTAQPTPSEEPSAAPSPTETEQPGKGLPVTSGPTLLPALGIGGGALLGLGGTLAWLGRRSRKATVTE